jgi:uncharacterized membrane protein (DUF4010 family)
VLAVLLNLHTLRANEGMELTTSAAMLVTCFAGILCGKGHTISPAAVMVIATALLAWKERLADFSMGLTESELRSALLLAILAIVIYPALPIGAVGPWQLIEPRAAWVTVILIAGIGFVNYILWKLYGTRGTELSGFLGGLVNSNFTVIELSSRVREAAVCSSNRPTAASCWRPPRCWCATPGCCVLAAGVGGLVRCVCVDAVHQHRPGVVELPATQATTGRTVCADR